MDSSVSAAVPAADQAASADPNWFFMAAGMLIGAAVIYGLYRLMPKPQVSPQTGILLSGAVLSAAASLIFLIVGIVSWIGGST